MHCGGVHSVNRCLIHWCFSMDFKGMQNLAQSVLFYTYVESSTIDCRIRLYNEMQRCSARPDKSQLESGEVHWNINTFQLQRVDTLEVPMERVATFQSQCISHRVGSINQLST